MSGPIRVTAAPSAHPTLDEADRNLLTQYFQGGHVLTAARQLQKDAVTGQAHRVPTGFATDGTFVWSFAVAYYVREHGIAPEPASFLDVVRSRSGECPRVSDEMLRALDGFAFAEPAQDASQ